jgi:hypothetical protein
LENKPNSTDSNFSPPCGSPLETGVGICADNPKYLRSTRLTIAAFMQDKRDKLIQFTRALNYISTSKDLKVNLP